jgi:hypothetical protein
MRRLVRVLLWSFVATILTLFVVFFLPGIVARADEAFGGSPARQVATSSLTGCYELKIGRWWPWGFPRETDYLTPPARIELLSQVGTQGFEKGAYLIRSIPSSSGAAQGHEWDSFWHVQGGRTELVWTTGFIGVTLNMRKEEDRLRGWAYPHFDAPVSPERVAYVTAQRISCGQRQADR